MTVICNDCGKEFDEEPSICTCQGVDFTEIEDSVMSMIDNNSNVIGFRAKPADIMYMFKLITLPSKGSNYTFPSFVLTKKGNDIYINEAMGSSIVGFFRFYEDYFLETWGEGQMPFSSEKAIEFIELMRHHNNGGVSVNYDKEQGITSFYSGKKDIISNRSEIVETINTCPDITESHTLKPFPFNEDAFCPILRSDADFKNGYSFKVNTSELKDLVKRAEKFNADFYPFKFNANYVEVGVNDMSNPVENGAFVKHIDCEIITPPPEEIYVELGASFVPIVNSINGEIEIVFVKSNMPVWIAGELTDDVGNVTGRFGFTLPPRTP